MPTIDLTDAELTAVTAAIRRPIEGDRYPHAPRLDPLRAALARLEAASAVRCDLAPNGAAPDKNASKSKGDKTSAASNDAPAHPKAPPAKADKRARR
jgi:hypothetical protein